MPEDNQTRQRGSYLSVAQQYDLDHACRLLTAAGFHTYQVGSSLTRADYRDVDLRAILFDDDYDRMFGNNARLLGLLNRALSELLAARTGLPIDFQFQRMTDCNREFDGQRNFVGVPIRNEDAR